jgi:hypothetical protein
MGWADAPVVNGGEKWKSAPVSEDIVASYADGGRVIRSQEGKLSFVSPSYSTNDPAIIAKIMETQKPQEAVKAKTREDIIAQNPIAARATKFVEGVPFLGSYVDELIGAAAGPEAAAGVRALSGAMQEQKPWQSTGLGLLGGITGTAATVAATPAKVLSAIAGPTGMRTLPAIGRGLIAGAAGGAVEGGIYGAGTGTDAASRAANAGTGAAVGGLLGGALGGAMPLIAKGAENVAGYFRRSDVDQIAKEFGISKQAATVIRNTFDQGGDFQAARDAVLRAGDEGMVADAGFAAQALLDASASTGGQAGTIARNEIEGRMVRTNAALESNLDTALGPAPLGPKTAVADIAKRTAPARDLAYTTAYSTPIDYSSQQGRQIEEVIGRIAPDDLISGITEANKEMLARGEVNQQIMAVLGPDGKVEFLREMPNVRQLDEIKKALQRIAYSRANTDDFGRLTGTGQRYSDLARQLKDATASAVPDYASAVSIGGDKLAEERAFGLGRDLLNPKTEIEDIGLELGKNPSQAQLSAAKSGLRSYIDKVMGDVRAVASDPNIDAREVMKAVGDLSSANARTKIRLLMGKEADALLKQVDQAAQSATVRAAMATNSKTAIRGNVKSDIAALTEPGIIGSAMQGEPVNTSKALIQAITGQTKEYTVAQQQKIFADIAKALTQKKGKSALAALDYIQKAIAGQPMTAAQNEFVAQQIAATGLLGGIPASQEMFGAR